MPVTTQAHPLGPVGVAMTHPDETTIGGYVRICEVTLTPHGYPKPIVATYRFRLADGALVISVSGQHIEVETGPILHKLLDRMNGINQDGEVPNAKAH
jgi:hypothetical protein